MAINAMSSVMHHLRRAVAQPQADWADGDLLECYAAQRDDAAFEALVRRHGPMVLGVCRRILRNEADAEDAFQATFLVLVRKAGAIRQRGMVSNWLYGVAQNTALKAKAMIQQRRRKEQAAGAMPKAQAAEEVWQQAQAFLDRELGRLAEKYRVPIVLCELEGKTLKEAARHLGWPQGTVATRLAEGRRRLAKQLSRQGLKLSAGALAALLSQSAAPAGVPARLVSATVQAAGLMAAGKVIASGVVSATVTVLTAGVLKAMLLSKLKTVTAGFLVLSMVAFGASFLLEGPRGANTAAADNLASQRTRTEERPADIGFPKISREAPRNLLALAAPARANPLRGSVVAADGSPAAGAIVWAARIGLGPLVRDETVADNNGRYQLNLDPGAWFVSARLGTQGGEGPARHETVNIAADRKPEPLTIRLEERGTFHGRLLEAGSGKPIAGGKLFLDVGFVVTTGADGRFKLGGLYRGNHEAFVVAPGRMRLRILFDTAARRYRAGGARATRR
jgi:RNA polymerase sigma factor (sigma-70 family)